MCEAIKKCDKKIQDALYGHILLAGGNTMFPGIAERLLKEISSLVPKKKKINVVAHPARLYSVWIGASILAQMATYEKLWVTKKDYEDNGVQVVQNMRH